MIVKFYGRLADVLGSEREVDIAGPCTVEDVRRLVARTWPDAEHAIADGKVRACIHDRIVADAHSVAPGDCVEFFPPVSGG